MNCQELYFDLFAIYLVPSDVTARWTGYPWNVPYSPEVTDLTLGQMGFTDHDGKTAFTHFMAYLNTLQRLTSYPSSAASSPLDTYCDEQMSASAKPKEQLPGIVWDSTVRCTAIHPQLADRDVMARLQLNPTDLVLVSADNDFFLLRTPAEGYRCEVVQNLSNAWRHDITFTLQNCHGIQAIRIDG